MLPYHPFGENGKLRNPGDFAPESSDSIEISEPVGDRLALGVAGSEDPLPTGRLQGDVI